LKTIRCPLQAIHPNIPPNPVTICIQLPHNSSQLPNPVIKSWSFPPSGTHDRKTPSNPKTPGHNAEQLDYFYENDFDQSKRIGLTKIGFPFNEVNLGAINTILKSGLKGTEIKYYINDKLQFSKVSKPIGDNQELYSMTHYFSDKNFWVRLFKKMVKPRSQYITEEIDLRKVFSEVK
jgi:hypothetical protein